WWSDADLRWLTGLHETSEGWYFNKESHEQMVWWSALPELVKIEAEPAAEKLRLRKLSRAIESELLAAERVHFRLRGAAPEASLTTSKPGTAAASQGGYPGGSRRPKDAAAAVAETEV